MPFFDLECFFHHFVAELTVSGGENIYAEVGEVGIENPAFESEADVKADVTPDVPDVAEQTKVDENQNFYANLSSEEWVRRNL